MVLETPPILKPLVTIRFCHGNLGVAKALVYVGGVEGTQCSVHTFIYLHGCSLLHSQVDRCGKPTWRRLVEAMKDPVGGNNPALAYEIARKNPGV